MSSWWLDEEPQPGEEFTDQEWSLFAIRKMNEQLRGVGIDMARGFANSLRQVGKSQQVQYQRAMEGLQVFGSVLDEAIPPKTAELVAALAPVIDATAKTEKRNKGRGIVPNHGPRPKSTYDRLGRRR